MNKLTKKLLRNVNMQNSKGFTLIEMLFCFMIFSIMVALLPLGFKVILDQKLMESRLQKMEWDVFVNQLRLEVQTSDQLQIADGRLILQYNGENVIFEKYGTNIRRVVDFRGHEIVLQKVETVQFIDLVNGLGIVVKDQFGNEHISNIFTFIDLESDI